MLTKEQQLYSLALDKLLAILDDHFKGLGTPLLSGAERLKLVKARLKAEKGKQDKFRTIETLDKFYNVYLNSNGGMASIDEQGAITHYTHRYNEGYELTKDEVFDADELLIKYSNRNKVKGLGFLRAPLTQKQRLTIIETAMDQKVLPSHSKDKNTHITIRFFLSFASCRVSLFDGALLRFGKGAFSAEFFEGEELPEAMRKVIDYQLVSHVNGKYSDDQMRVESSIYEATDIYPCLGFERGVRFYDKEGVLTANGKDDSSGR